MNDTLDYFKKTPEERRAQYHKLTFSMAYFPQEHYLLPLSHDEVVHGKAAIVQKMYGDYEQKFPQARALYLYMMVHPGKKLNFMGSELGHMREWDEARELDWMLLQYPIHDAFRHFTEELNRLYLSNDAFWQSEYDPAHFQWLDCQADGTCLYAFLRRGGTHTVAAAFNFGDTPRPVTACTCPSPAVPGCFCTRSGSALAVLCRRKRLRCARGPLEKATC